MGDDEECQALLELNGVRLVIDGELGLWVKFDVRPVKPSQTRPHGLKYSLTLHNRRNERLIGFDNAHAVNDGFFDHYHRDAFDKGRRYHFVTAEKLITDFWKAVDHYLKENEVNL